MKIKINKQNNIITINDVLSLPIDNKIVIEFEKETLNSGAIIGDKIGDDTGGWIPVPHIINAPLNAAPYTETAQLAGSSCDFIKKMNHEYVSEELLTKRKEQHHD